MVEQDQKTHFHVIRNFILLPQQIKGKAAAEQAQGDPALGHTGHKHHAHKDKNIHQRAAHIAGDHIVNADQRHKVTAQHGNGGNGFQIPRFLQPDQLLGKDDDEGDLHHLRRLDIDGKAFDTQPRPVVVDIQAQRRDQQQDKAEIKRRQPFPVLRHFIHINGGHDKIQSHAQQQRTGLHDHIFQRPGIVGGAGDHQNAEQRGHRAKRQQQHVRLAKNIRYKFFCALQHMSSPLWESLF